jgi:hypothetical protein
MNANLFVHPHPSLTIGIDKMQRRIDFEINEFFRGKPAPRSIADLGYWDLMAYALRAQIT